MRALLLLLALGAALAPAFARVHRGEVVIYADQSEEGKKRPVPTAEAPQFYVLVPGGYRELGAVYANETAVPEERVLPLVRTALASAHYLEAAPGSPRIDLFIVFHWGSLNPSIDRLEDGEGNVIQEVRWDQQQMAQLIGAHKSLAKMPPWGWRREEVLQQLDYDRYFLVVSAFDFDTFAKERKRVPLWRARISTEALRTSLDEVLPLLAARGAQWFGRTTELPVTENYRLERRAEVIVGEPTVVEDEEPIDY